jgi:hypothetical protein
MRVYKGTDKDMKCRGFQYKLGEAAVFDGEPHLCRAGLHACEQPIDVLNHYAPNKSRYFEADAEEVTDERESDDSKIVAKKMTLKAEIGVPGLVKAQIEYVKRQIGFDDAIKRANAEKKNHATGYQGAASTTGYQGAASATGKAGVALAAGLECKAMGALGCAICCVERDEWNGKTYPIVAVKAAIVDGENIRADTWYQLKNGEFVEVE